MEKDYRAKDTRHKLEQYNNLPDKINQKQQGRTVIPDISVVTLNTEEKDKDESDKNEIISTKRLMT